MSSQKKKKRGAAPLDICIQIQIFFFLFLFSSVAAKSYVVIFSSSLPFLLQFSHWGFFWPSCSSFQGYKRLRLWKWRFLASLCSRQAHRDSRDKTTLIQRYQKVTKYSKFKVAPKYPGLQYERLTLWCEVSPISDPKSYTRWFCNTVCCLGMIHYVPRSLLPFIFSSLSYQTEPKKLEMMCPKSDI